MTLKERFATINTTAQVNFDMAQGMLAMLNDIYGTNYLFIKKRVCYETIEHGVRTFHDAWVCAE